jgi:hypothetical protein
MSAKAKKILKGVVTAILSFALFVTPAFASEQDSDDEYIRFEPSLSRMASDGSFTFSLRNHLFSDEFVANGSTVTVQTSGHLMARGVEYYGTEETYYVGLRCTSLLSYGLVGTYVAVADGSYVGLKFDVVAGRTYELEIYPASTFRSNGYYDAQYYLEGYGTVSNVTVK